MNIIEKIGTIGVSSTFMLVHEKDSKCEILRLRVVVVHNWIGDYLEMNFWMGYPTRTRFPTDHRHLSDFFNKNNNNNKDK